jgi:hypothetical protein
MAYSDTKGEASSSEVMQVDFEEHTQSFSDKLMDAASQVTPDFVSAVGSKIKTVSNSLKNATFESAANLVTKLESQTKMPLTALANGAFTTTASLTSIFGPQMNRDMLIDLNCGVLLDVNGSSHSIYNMNNGVSLFANGYSIDTVYGTNNGLLAATELSV